MYQPNYQITDKILNCVQEIAALTTVLSIEKRELHLRKENRIRSIQSSLAIENNSLSIEQVTDIIDGKRVLGPLKDIHEVQNAYEAYEKAFQMNPYSVHDFLLAHQLLTSNLVKQSGQFRLGDVGIYDMTGEVIHVGARPQFVPNLVKDLFEWGEKSTVSDIIKSCIIHFELEIIHPFEDGNGRMGRLWQSVLLSQWNAIFEWVPIESVIYNHQQGYYEALAISNKANDATIFIEFMLDAIVETLKTYQNHSMISEKQTLYHTLKPKELLIYKTIKEYLVNNQCMSASQFSKILNLSPASTRRYLSLFVEKDLLKVTGNTKSTLYWLNK